MAAKAANMTPELMRFIEKSLLIQVLDAVWKEHLYALDHLRQGIGLRAYGQRDPLNEYKSEAFVLFNAMLDELKERVTSMLARVELAPEGPAEPIPPPRPLQMFELHPEPELAFAGPGEDGPRATMEMRSGPAPMPMSVRSMRADAVDPNDPATWRNAARNGPCPCGSGKKYKHCHGKLN
jgi:preprotein translocase subunit SecA